MAKTSTARRIRQAYQGLSNDDLAAVYMEELSEYKRIERTLAVIRAVAQERMESLSLRYLPTNGPVRIKGVLLTDLRPEEIGKGEGAATNLCIKRVKFAYKDVVEEQQLLQANNPGRRGQK